MTQPELETEFDRQVNNLIKKGYPQEANLSSTEFTSLLNPLKDKLKSLSLPEVDLEKGTIPFVIIIKGELVPVGKMMFMVNKEGKEGITKLFPHEPTDFAVIESVSIPPTTAYLLQDIDRGKETLNIPPSEALKIIIEQERSPLTIDEGVAIVTHYPEFLIRNNCFSLLASRNSKDKRVPAIWINGQDHPNLGWCWDGNPHTWLGSASCKGRQ